MLFPLKRCLLVRSIELDEKQQEENAKQEAELEKTLSKVAQLRHRAMIDELELSRSAEGFESESPVSMRQPPKKSTLKICLRRAGQKDYGITIGHVCSPVHSLRAARVAH